MSAPIPEPNPHGLTVSVAALDAAVLKVEQSLQALNAGEPVYQAPPPPIEVGHAGLAAMLADFYTDCAAAVSSLLADQHGLAEHLRRCAHAYQDTEYTIADKMTDPADSAQQQGNPA